MLYVTYRSSHELVYVLHRRIVWFVMMWTRRHLALAYVVPCGSMRVSADAFEKFAGQLPMCCFGGISHIWRARVVLWCRVWHCCESLAARVDP